METLSTLRAEIERLNARLKSLADEPVDINDPDWLSKLEADPSPLDRAGIRAEAESTLAAAIRFYEHADPPDRAALRALFAKNRAFRWAAAFPFGPETPDHLFAHLLLFSIVDQGDDARDAVLWLDRMLADCGLPHGKVSQLRRQAAALSSDVDRFGFGSTQQLLMKGYGSYAASR